MDIIILKRAISDAFLAGVYTETFRETDNGGPECAAYMSLEYRLITNVIMVSVIVLCKYFRFLFIL